MAGLTTFLAEVGSSCISSCPFHLCPSSLPLDFSDSAALPDRQSYGDVKQGLRRLRGSMCLGSLEVKDLQPCGLLAKLCWKPPVGIRHLHQECWLLPQGSAYCLNATTAKKVTSRHCFNKHQKGFLSQSPIACSSLLSLVLFLRGWITPAANQVAYEWSNTPIS